MVGVTKTLILVSAIATTLVVGQDSQDYSYSGGDYGAYSDNNYYGKNILKEIDLVPSSYG